ncbi:MAG TPA: radical SAM protein, partial [Chloroflexota bacterium]|nr:radical SAM protein [Chloroflexota bacterium]
FLQFGYPGETLGDVEKTLQMVRDCRPDDIGVSVSYPLPGTKFHEAVRRQLGSKQNWRDSSDLAMLYRGPFTTAFYRKLHTVVHREFRSRQGWHELRLVVRQPGTVRPKHLRRVVGLLVHQLALPIERWRLKRLALTAHRPLPVSPRQLSAAAAAQPSAQEEETSHEKLEHSG